MRTNNAVHGFAANNMAVLADEMLKMISGASAAGEPGSKGSKGGDEGSGKGIEDGKEGDNKGPPASWHNYITLNTEDKEKHWDERAFAASAGGSACIYFST